MEAQMKIGETKDYKLAGNPCGGGLGREGVESIIEVEMRYQKDAYVGRPRGYYLWATPVGIKRENGYSLKSFTIGAGPRGLNVLLLEVKRQSPKAEAEASRLADEKEATVVQAVLVNNGLTLAEGVTA
jgi:hypothetical protein